MSDTSNSAAEPFDDPAFDKQTVTNDAVAGETVIPGESYAGPNGAEAAEAEPGMDENDLAGQQIQLDDTEDGVQS